MHDLLPTVALAPALLADIAPYWRFSGVFHPASTHLPIGLLTVAGLIEMYHAVRRNRTANTTAVVCLVIGTLGAVGATLLGWAMASGMGGMVKDSPERAIHRWLGVALAVASPTIAIFALLAHRNAERRTSLRVYRIGAISMVGLVSLTGMYGGKLAYPNSYANAWDKLMVSTGRSTVAEDVEPVSIPGFPEGTTSRPTTGPGSDASAGVPYAAVHAIFQAKCVSCHGPEKQKGKYRCDTRAWAMKPGADGEAKPIIPGDGKNSTVYQMVLGIGDYADSKMPPDGKNELTPAEVAVLKDWIDQGAK